MLTRSHYRAIAEAFAQQARTFPEAQNALFTLALNIAQVLTENNPRFDRGRFFAACFPLPPEPKASLDPDGQSIVA
jgi:hypothetical protein